MGIKLITDAAERVHEVRVGQETDKLFEMVMFLSEYAHERAMFNVALKLEDVLDSILHVERRVDRAIAGKRATRRDKGTKEAVADTTPTKRRLVSELHSGGVVAN